MAKGHSGNKDRLIELVILAFVIVTVSLLVVQIGTNVADILDQDGTKRVTANPAVIPEVATPSEPTPTVDFSVPITDF